MYIYFMVHQIACYFSICSAKLSWSPFVLHSFRYETGLSRFMHLPLEGSWPQSYPTLIRPNKETHNPKYDNQELKGMVMVTYSPCLFLSFNVRMCVQKLITLLNVQTEYRTLENTKGWGDRVWRKVTPTKIISHDQQQILTLSTKNSISIQTDCFFFKLKGYVWDSAPAFRVHLFIGSFEIGSIGWPVHKVLVVVG